MICPECHCDHDLVIRACQKDLIAFAKIMCGFVVGDEHELEPSDNFHGRISRWYQEQEDQQRREVAIIIFRGALKSSIFTVAETLRKLSINPNKRFGIFSASGDLTAKWVGQMERIVTSKNESHGFSHFFPHLIPAEDTRKNWNQTEFTINRTGIYPQPSVQALSVGTKITGGKYTDIILDDLIDDQTSESPALMQRAIRFYNECRRLWANPRTGNLLINATLWPGGLYESVLADKHVSKLVLGLLRDKRWADFSGEPADGQLVWPEGPMTMEQFEREMDRNPYTASHQYLNILTEKGQERFEETDMRYYTADAEYEVLSYVDIAGIERRVNRHDLEIHMTVDPSTGLGQDDSAIIVAGWYRAGNLVFVFDAWSGRALLDGLTNQIIEHWKRWRPIDVGIEEGAAQAVYQPAIRNAAAQRGYSLPIRGLSVGSKSKDSRFLNRDGLLPFFHQHQVYLLPSQRSLVRQLVNYVPGRVDQKDDMIDALCHQVRFWRSVISEKPEEPWEIPWADEKKEEERPAGRWYGLGMN